MQNTIEFLDRERIEIGNLLVNKSEYSQYLTPLSVARFMASLFDKKQNKNLNILDAGAGIGTLTATLIERFIKEKVSKVNCTTVEVDDILGSRIPDTLSAFESQLDIALNRVSEDFIVWAVEVLEQQAGLFNEPGKRFTHVILNPPYKKMRSNSKHRNLLRSQGIETVNLYSAFLALAIKLLEPGGQLVAIIPRSFCNGPYYKPFRELILEETAIKHLHLFESRNKAFKDDSVLQENVIIKLERGAIQEQVKVSTSTDDNFMDYQENDYIFEKIVQENDVEKFFHIPISHEEGILELFPSVAFTLKDLGISVSTGPVVGFRTKENLRMLPEEGSVPLLYPTHIESSGVRWIKEDSKKPNAIMRNDQTEKMLYPSGYYTIVRRFSAKEERKRLISGVVIPDLFNSPVLGFDNGLNVLHQEKNGLEKEVAFGLNIYLSSTIVDKYFRLFNGHTQVNATDLRTMLFPSLEVLTALGTWYLSLNRLPTQEEIDETVEGILTVGTSHSNIDQAIDILKKLGIPKAQHNERSALCLLALLNLGPDKMWHQAEKRLIGITPIMEFSKNKYGKKYAPNTRETFRRFSMHQFVEAGIAKYNPDKPDRPVNSPKAVYQIEEETLELIKKYGTIEWDLALTEYLEGRMTLIEKYAKERAQNKIPVQIAPGKEILITPGEHSELIKSIIEDFGPRFVPGGTLIYAGDTGDKMGYFDEALLNELGVKVNSHGKMPDVVIYYPEKDWLILIEAVTSHGPVDGKRHGELETLFKNSKVGIVYVTAFPTRSIMARYSSEIAWETEVWVSDAPSHMIHFNGVRFLGPY